ncbi:MAG: hypothetical protein QOG63_1470 [Thermoleophilaceae bacterium]|jgi:uncharacterized protein (DUF2236 family)|nr:hypothetical protein [Thermoleophilaceae bacterium]
MLLGGGRALILQVAHPVVAAGVARFSNYAEAPWERLVGTLDLYLHVIYGGRDETAAEAGERLRALHKRIKGVDADGHHWHALDPAAFHWVHATLLQSMVEMRARFGQPLTTLERELFYEEMCEVGKLYGLRERDMPPDWTAFEDYFADMVARELRDSQLLRDVLGTIFRPAKPPLLPLPEGLWNVLSAPGSQLVRLTTIGSLPPVLRRRLNLPWSRERELALRAQQEAIRRIFPRLPDRLRLMPPALAARRGETRALAA